MGVLRQRALPLCPLTTNYRYSVGQNHWPRDDRGGIKPILRTPPSEDSPSYRTGVFGHLYVQYIGNHYDRGCRAAFSKVDPPLRLRLWKDVAGTLEQPE